MAKAFDFYKQAINAGCHAILNCGDIAATSSQSWTFFYHPQADMVYVKHSKAQQSSLYSIEVQGLDPKEVSTVRKVNRISSGVRAVYLEHGTPFEIYACEDLEKAEKLRESIVAAGRAIPNVRRENAVIPMSHIWLMHSTRYKYSVLRTAPEFYKADEALYYFNNLGVPVPKSVYSRVDRRNDKKYLIEVPEAHRRFLSRNDGSWEAKRLTRRALPRDEISNLFKEAGGRPRGMVYTPDLLDYAEVVKELMR
mgnify:CR=1 FL=1